MLQGDVDDFICGQLWFTRNGQIGHLCFDSSWLQFLNDFLWGLNQYGSIGFTKSSFRPFNWSAIMASIFWTTFVNDVFGLERGHFCVFQLHSYFFVRTVVCI